MKEGGGAPELKQPFIVCLMANITEEACACAIEAGVDKVVQEPIFSSGIYKMLVDAHIISPIDE